MSKPSFGLTITSSTTYKYYLLEKLERFHAASSVGKEQSQVIFCHILSEKGGEKRGQILFFFLSLSFSFSKPKAKDSYGMLDK